MTDEKIDETARRLAATTGHPYDDWLPAVEAWWAAGHDLDRLYEWAAGGQRVSPAAVVDGIAALNRLGAGTVPAYRTPPTRPDRFTVWTQNAIVIVVAAALAAVVAAVAWRAVVWIWP